MKKLINLVAAITAAACTNPVVTVIEDCEVPCTEAADCFGNQTCELGLCTTGTVCDVPEVGTGPEGVACEPGTFQGCNADNSASICDDTGTAISRTECAAGCNADAARCNECVPDAATCSGNELQTCGADGLIASTESCTLGCVDDPAHCAKIVPAFLPTVCDAPATEASLVFPSGQQNVLDTTNAANCNGGIITQSGGPEVCVVRYGAIAVDGPLEVIGSRAIAFVADGDLDIDNIVDVSARRRLSGPGGGRRSSGSAPNNGGGSGGGAGGKQVGGNGATDPSRVDSAAGSGGATIDPSVTQVFEGGARAPSAIIFGNNYRPTSGGGGGALMLISCMGEVRMAGTIDAGGGGGDGGGDGDGGAGILLLGGAGGGAGGYVVVQGAKVTVSGRLFANGGGGGGGCNTGGCIGGSGEDGARIRARGGGVVLGTPAGVGGAGGFDATSPNNGSPGTSPGGGGGSVGRFQIYTPAGVTPTTAGATAIPAFEPSRTISTR